MYQILQDSVFMICFRFFTLQLLNMFICRRFGKFQFGHPILLLLLYKLSKQIILLCLFTPYFLFSGGMKLDGAKGNLLMLLIFIFPPLWFFLCLPFHRWSRIPTLKFLCHVISHTYFILVLILCIVLPWDRSGLEVGTKCTITTGNQACSTLEKGGKEMVGQQILG